jgi:hypothetical protein
MTVQELSCSYTSILLIFVAGCGYHLSVTRHKRVVFTRLRPLGSKVRHVLYNIALRTVPSDDCDYVMTSVTSGDVMFGIFILLDVTEKPIPLNCCKYVTDEVWDCGCLGDDIRLCVDTSVLKDIHCFHLQSKSRRWRQDVAVRCWYPPTKLLSGITQNTTI